MTQVLGSNAVTIIDTGCANLSSVRFALERIGAAVTVTRDLNVIAASPRVILPGVGSAQAGMAALKQTEVLDLLPSLTQPVLGICLGMQMLGISSEESAVTESSNDAIDTTTLSGIVPFTIEALKSGGMPLPHMGWNTLEVDDHPLFQGINDGEYVYFVHSYGALLASDKPSANADVTIAKCTYGQPFAAAVAQGNFMGVQFHPERSGQVGAKILKNFMEMKG